jgi:methionyl-tRNA formyltransferase
MDPLRIIFAGSGEFGVPTLTALLDSVHEIVQVITQPDRPAGRGRALTPTRVASLASSRNLPLIKTQNVNAESLPPADLLIVIAFGQKIAPHIVDHARLGAINLHASLLPKYRGAAPINWAMIHGETVTGNSVIRLAQKMDAGAILAQSRLDIGELETAGELHDRLAQDGATLVPPLVEKMARGEATESPQDESLATLAPKLSREQSKLDFAKPAIAVANQIRGMYPWPGCRARLLDETAKEISRITLVRAKAGGLTSTSSVESQSAGFQSEPGVINADLTISAGQGVIEVVELQPEGGRAMSISAFRNGHAWRPGLRVEPA